MKVRSHLVLTVAAAMLPLTVFSAIGLKMLMDDEREAALNRMRETVRATSLLVDRELTNAQSALNVLATSQLLKAANYEGFHEQANTASRAKGTWTVLSRQDGQQLANTLVPYGTPLPRINFDLSDRPLKGMPNGAIRVTNLLSGAVRRDWVVALERNVFLDSERKYVLSQGFSPEYFDRVLSGQDRPVGWIIAILDREGINIARSHRARDFVGKPTIPALQAQIRDGTSGLVQATSLDGFEIYAVHSRSELSGWTVALGVPREEIERTARSAVLMVALGLLTALACAALTAVLFGRRLVRAIQDAERSAMALGRGLEPLAATSGVIEVDRLHAVLGQTGAMLSRERASRQQAEAERTRLLVSEQEARRLADAQNRQKDEFMAMLGHELRNPLAAIAGAFSVMESPGISSDLRHRAQAVGKRQAAHLSRIVDDLLDVARVMAGKIQLKRQPLELGEFVTQCVDARRSIQDSRHKWSLEAEVVWVDADPTRLEQILGNLLANAEKYTPDGGDVEIRVSAGEGEAVVEIRDTGIGIDPDLLSRIFDPFVQGPTSIDRAQGGLGLGLALAHQLMRLHGGAIEAVSAGAGTGSLFTLRLPRRMPPASRRAQDDKAPARRVSRQIAIVEDNEDGRQMLAAVLELNGFQVQGYSDGETALQGMLHNPPEVAIIDIGLPGMSGYEIARRLRQDPQMASVHLIALTGYGMEQDRTDARQAGFAVHLTKPYTITQLLQAITETDAAGPDNPV